MWLQEKDFGIPKYQAFHLFITLIKKKNKSLLIMQTKNLALCNCSVISKPREETDTQLQTSFNLLQF